MQGTYTTLWVGIELRNQQAGISQVVQWLRLRASTAGGTGSIPGPGTKIPYAEWQGQKKRPTTLPALMALEDEAQRHWMGCSESHVSQGQNQD